MCASLKPFVDLFRHIILACVVLEHVSALEALRIMRSLNFLLTYFERSLGGRKFGRFL